MPSDSVASFLHLVRSNRLFETEQFHQVFDRPDTPQQNVPELCDYLQSRGILTRFQTELIRSGHMSDLTFAGYPILGERGPFPGGVAYSALHPSLRTPVVLRRYRTEWFGPADNAAAFVHRAQASSVLVHEHLTTILDAGVYQDEPFVAIEEFKGGDLQTLVADIGPMPGPLAAEYGRQVASALQAAHAKQLTHGHVRPDGIVVSPLTPMSKTRPDGTPRFRPSATASAKLTDLGLLPLRPPLATWATNPDVAIGSLAYFAPERVDAGDPTPAGDVYGLGATLYFLLTGRAPFFGVEPMEILDAVRSTPPASLKALRPDLSDDLVSFVNSLLAKMPMARPSAADALEQLSRFGFHTAAPVAVIPPPPSATPPDIPPAVVAPVAVDPPPPTPAFVPPVDSVPLAITVGPSNDGEVPLVDANEIPLAIAGAVRTGDTEVNVTLAAAMDDAVSNAPQNPDAEADTGIDVAPLQPAPGHENFAPLTALVPEALPIPDALPIPEGGWAPTPYAGPMEPTAQAIIPPAYEGELPPEGNAWNGSTDYVEQVEYDPAVHADNPQLVTHDEESGPPPPRPSNRGKLFMWLGLGLGMQVLAVLGWLYLVMQPGCPKEPNSPQNKQRR